MNDADRKLLWSGVFVAAILAVEFLAQLLIPVASSLSMLRGAERFSSDANHWLAAGTVALALFAAFQWRETRRTAIRQLRAYVQFDGGIIFDAGSANPLMGGVVVSTVSIKNTGQTPADKVAHWMETVVWPLAQEDKLVPGPVKDMLTSTMGAGQTTSSTRWSPKQLTLQEVQDVTAGVSGLYVHGMVVYKDIFKKTRTTRYRLIWSRQYPPPVGARLIFCINGNSFD